MSGAGRVVLITGCSSGIGACAADRLRERGYRVIATARKSDDVERLAARGFDALRLDLADSDSIQRAVKEALERTDGRIDALFNNGAYGQPGAVEDLTRAVLRRQFETNLFGWHELTCAVLPVMRAQGHGRIVQNSSILGLIALSFRGAYNASKFALEGLTDTLRMELHGSGIHVSLIEPGPITSRFREHARDAFTREIDVQNSPFRARYESVLARLDSADEDPFTLAPDAVVKRLVHALESPRPRVRYYVTTPTYLFGFLRRVLTHRGLDRVLQRVTQRESAD